MSTACDLLLLSTCGIKDHNSASNSSSSSGQPAADSTAAGTSPQAPGLVKSLKQLLRVRGSRRPHRMASSAPMPPAPSPALPRPQVYVVGSPNPKSPFLRIAHVSDTCGLPDFVHSAAAYEADVIVHSGNLCSNQLRKHFFRDAEFLNQLKAINEFFVALPHRFKIFVPGPNEAASFAEAEDRERLQALLPNCIYLHDSGCVIEGVRFHGVGCVGRRGFGRSAEARTAWSNVPDGVDVLVSHSVPTNSLYEDLVTRLRPKMLLYGSRLHRSSRGDQPPAAEENSVKFKDNVIFANGHAGNGNCKRGLFDFYPDELTPRVTQLPQVSPEAVSEAFRSLPSAGGGGADGGGNGGRYGGLLRCILS